MLDTFYFINSIFLLFLFRMIHVFLKTVLFSGKGH